jgi:hypothetical protein
MRLLPDFQLVEVLHAANALDSTGPLSDDHQEDIKKEDFVRPYGLAMERRKRLGVYFIFKSLEQGPTFCYVPPRLVGRLKGQKRTHTQRPVAEDLVADVKVVMRVPGPTAPH